MTKQENPTTTSPARGVTTRPCECSYWVNRDGAKLTDCTKQTNSSKKLFLPGHDAKLKGALIKAKHANIEVSDGRGLTGSPVDLASRFGFGHMVASATPRVKTPAPGSPDLAEVVESEEAKHEAEQVAKDEAEAVTHVRNVRPRRSARKATTSA